MTRGQFYVAYVIIFLAVMAPVPCSDTSTDKDLPAPLKDHDMTCVAENLDYMTCHWPRQGPGVAYQMTVTPQTHSPSDHSCKVHCDTTTCHCYIPPRIAMIYGNHSLLLNATNQAGSTLSNFQRDMDNPIARSGPVSDLTIQSSARSISLTWIRPEDLSSIFVPDNELSYIVTYHDKKDHRQNLSASHSPVNVTNLRPAREYVFHVQSQILNSSYTGNDTIIHGWTMQAEPERSPHLVTYRRDAKCGKDTCLLVFWQPIPLDYQNGEILKHTIDAHTLRSLGDNITVSVSPDTTSSAAVFTDLDANMTYKLSIKGCNSAGCSPSHEMVLPSLENAPASISRIYGVATKGQKNLTFHWQPLHEPVHLLLTTVLCSTGATSCQSALRTISVDPVAGHYEVENPDPGHRYGMVTVVNGTMGGLAEDWMCIYVKDGVPSRPDFHLQSWDAHSIVVKVQVGECGTSLEENVAVSLKFLLTYGKGACNNANSVELEADGEVLHTITDLQPGTTYMLCLKALGEFQNSTEVTHSVVTNTDIVPWVVGIVMLVLGVVLIVIIMILRLKDTWTIYVEKPPHEVPSGMPQYRPGNPGFANGRAENFPKL